MSRAKTRRQRTGSRVLECGYDGDIVEGGIAKSQSRLGCVAHFRASA